MSTLTHLEILHRLACRPKSQRLTISPLLSERQVGEASVDLRLGNQFIVFRRHAQAIINAETTQPQLHIFQERRVIPFGKTFVLHPGVLALAATFEYVKLPPNLEGQLEGRSSWARLGLQIATASFVEPGFSGVVTFELANVGNMPLELTPGRRVAQLILRQTASAVRKPYTGKRKYKFPIGPQFSRVASDYDATAFKR